MILIFKLRFGTKFQFHYFIKIHLNFFHNEMNFTFEII